MIHAGCPVDLSAFRREMKLELELSGMYLAASLCAGLTSE